MYSAQLDEPGERHYRPDQRHSRDLLIFPNTKHPNGLIASRPPSHRSRVRRTFPERRPIQPSELN